jgi:hypothetical protein
MGIFSKKPDAQASLAALPERREVLQQRDVLSERVHAEAIAARQDRIGGDDYDDTSLADADRRIVEASRILTGAADALGACEARVAETEAAIAVEQDKQARAAELKRVDRILAEADGVSR